MNIIHNEAVKENRRLNFYLVLFIFAALYNAFSFAINNQVVRCITSLIFSLVVIWLAEKKNVWATLMMKFLVWLHILLLLLVVILFFVRKI